MFGLKRLFKKARLTKEEQERIDARNARIQEWMVRQARRLKLDKLLGRMDDCYKRRPRLVAGSSLVLIFVMLTAPLAYRVAVPRETEPTARELRYAAVQVPTSGYSSMKLSRKIADIRDTLSRYAEIGDSLMHKTNKTHEDSMEILRAYTYIKTMTSNDKEKETEK